MQRAAKVVRKQVCVRRKKTKKSYLTDEKWYDKQAQASKQVKTREKLLSRNYENLA